MDRDDLHSLLFFFLDDPRSGDAEDSVRAEVAHDCFWFDVLWEDVLPGKVSGDEAVLVLLLFVLSFDEDRVVYRFYCDLLGGELLDVEFYLKLFFITVHLTDSTFLPRVKPPRPVMRTHVRIQGVGRSRHRGRCWRPR